MQKLLTYKSLVAQGYIANRTTLQRRIRRGEFPAPIRVGPRAVAWIKSEIEAWEAARLAERARRAGLPNTSADTRIDTDQTQRPTQETTQPETQTRSTGHARPAR